MPTYAIGDIQGCLDELLELLELIQFDKTKDTIWLTGDLVNRGPNSLDTLREIKGMGQSVISVLGNHDLYLIALTRVPKAFSQYSHTLHDILSANDKDELVDWLRSFPLLHYDKKLNFALVHAGIYPTWDLADALTYSKEVTKILNDDSEIDNFLKELYGDNPLTWKDTLSGIKRLRFITNSFTRMRYCNQDRSLNLREKKHPLHASPNLVPWFAAPFRRKTNVSIAFGHWSSLTLNDEHKREYKVFPTDTGAVWKGTLTALRIDDLKYFTTKPRSKKNS
tara:strand:+ start:448 stop:1287 length:840 start_codon:yes stop_codon:yes gene_type:complete